MQMFHEFNHANVMVYLVFILTVRGRGTEPYSLLPAFEAILIKIRIK